MRSFAWRTTSVGPGYLRDVFSGQVLALHPLSGFFMNDPGLMAVAGRFFACDAFDRVMAGRPGDCPEYWAFVGAVLDAAGMYRLAAEEQAAGRGVRCRRPRGGGSQGDRRGWPHRAPSGVAAPVARLRPPSGEDPPDPPSTGPPPGGMRRGRPRRAGPPPIAPARAELVPDFGPCSDRRR